MKAEKNINKSAMRETLFKDYPEIISVDQLQEMLNIGPVLAYNLVKTKVIPAMKIGREYKIPKVHVINFIEKGCEIKYD